MGGHPGATSLPENATICATARSSSFRQRIRSSIWTVTDRRPHSISLIALVVAVLALGVGSSQNTDDRSKFDELAARAQVSREAGRSDEAIRLYQDAVKIRPDWQEGWWYIGTLAYDADRYAEGIPALQKLVELNPQIGAAWGFLGLCEFETKDYVNSRTHLAKGKELGYAEGPEVARVARYHLALLFNLNREFEKATELLSAESGREKIPEQIQVALGLALLRVPLLPTQIDPANDGLVHAAGEAAGLMASGNAEAAVDELKQVIADHPRTPYLHLALAAALAKLGRNVEGRQQLLEESHITPTSPLPFLQLASLSLAEHHLDEAIENARRAVHLAPRSSAAHAALAGIYTEAGKNEEAADETRVALELTANAAEADAAPAGLYARSAGALDSPSPTGGEPDTHFEQLALAAAEDRQRGQTEAAAIAYQEALKLRPQWQEGWWWLGALSYMSAHHAEAVRALQNVVKFEPQRGEAWAMLGLSEFEMKDYSNALIHLERGRQLGLKGDAAAVRTTLYHLALLLVRSGQFDEAMDLLIPHTAAGPYEREIRFAMGLALLRIPSLPEQIQSQRLSLVQSAGEAAALLARSRYAEALPVLQQLLSQSPDTPYLHYAYGVSLASLSRYDEAEAQLREETRISPQSALPYLRLASVSLQTHHPEQALNYARRAVELSPDSGKAHYALGRSWLEIGRTDQAIAELEAAREMAPSSPEVRFNLARAYAKAGRTDAAEQERAVFVKLNAQAEQQRSAYGSQPAKSKETDATPSDPSHN